MLDICFKLVIEGDEMYKGEVYTTERFPQGKIETDLRAYEMLNEETRNIRIDDMVVGVNDLPPTVPGLAKGLDRHLRPFIAAFCGIQEQDILRYTIRHRSLDARKKPELKIIYRLDVTLRDGCVVRDDPKIMDGGPPPDENHPLYRLQTIQELPKHPIIVGTGPAGVMAAYLFALHGCAPVILDRGFDVERRDADIAEFLATRRLHPESNYLFGEGGAGTYSDGKLFTRTKDHRIRFILEVLVGARAPRRILYDHHPHIGSDILPHVVRRLRERIKAWGGIFLWGSRVTDIIIRNNRCRGVVLASGESVEGPLTLIAPGHSARDLIRTLLERDVSGHGKDFQLGCRIEHPQPLIDQAQYGWLPARHLVGAATYQLTSSGQKRSQKRKPSGGKTARRTGDAPGVTTFCMCPGGEIIPATSDAGQLCTNGMSPFRRSGSYANAGLIVNQRIGDFGALREAFDLLRDLEKRAFEAGGSDYSSPAQSAAAFVRGEDGLHTSGSSYRLGLVPARLDRLLPRLTVSAIQKALPYFETRVRGFMQSGVLVGVETRVSSPVRFERDPDTMASSLPGLYLAGEGAGFGSGIISSALDGLRIAETILTGRPARRKMAMRECDVPEIREGAES